MKTKIITLITAFFIITSTSFADSDVTGDKDAAKKAIFEKVEIAFANASEIVVVDAVNEALDAIPQDTKESLCKALCYPAFASRDLENDMVAVSFTYDEDGYIKVLSSNASDEELNAYLKDILEEIRLRNGSVTIGKAYNAKFHFKLL
jgi:hypothetical protein